MHLADQTVPDWQSSGTLQTQGSSGEHNYLKAAIHLQVGWLIELSRHFALDVALFTSLKSGFRDTGSGAAADLGLRGELVVWLRAKQGRGFQWAAN